MRVRELPPGIADREALFDALAEALSFPDYFGRNWDAVADCLSDVEPTVLRVDASLWDHAPELARTLVELWSETEGQELEFVRKDASTVRADGSDVHTDGWTVRKDESNERRDE